MISESQVHSTFQKKELTLESYFPIFQFYNLTNVIPNLFTDSETSYCKKI